MERNEWVASKKERRGVSLTKKEIIVIEIEIRRISKKVIVSKTIIKKTVNIEKAIVEKSQTLRITKKSA